MRKETTIEEVACVNEIVIMKCVHLIIYLKCNSVIFKLYIYCVVHFQLSLSCIQIAIAGLNILKFVMTVDIQFLLVMTKFKVNVSSFAVV